MGYFKEWNDRLADTSDPEGASAFMDTYYQLETEAYDRILGGYPEPVEGTAAELAAKLGFESEMVVFAGFLDGVQTSLRTPVELDSLSDETDLSLDIDFEKLLWNMYDARADWLVSLESWDAVLPEERRDAIAKEYRVSKTAVRDKPGRNDPCPCGSGKKYKRCCGK